MRILFVWTGVTSYMADCWRTLAAMPGVELKVVVERVDSGKEFDAAKVLAGLDYELVEVAPKVRTSAPVSRSTFNLQPSTFDPDVIFAVGWHSQVVKTYVAAFPEVPKVCCFDMPWRWLPRCIAARFVLHGWVRRFAAAYVPGKCAARYAKWLGFKHVEKGLFSIDQRKFSAENLSNEVRPDLTKSGFFYVGRFSAEKRIDLIERAYARYLELGGSWPLDMYGNGKPDEGQRDDEPTGRRIVRHGFLQPAEMAKVFRGKACLLLASAFDPWPLVILEAKSAGCEVIASDRCGNADELGARKYHYGDVEAMAREMLAVETKVKSKGERVKSAECSSVIAPYDCRAWAERTLAIAKDLV